MGKAGIITTAAGTQDIEAFTQALLDSLPPIYEKERKDTVLYKMYRALAQELQKADIILETVGNNNYLSVQVTDELQVRTILPRDRLKNENAFQLDGIRFNPTNAQILQNIFLKVGTNVIQLYFIPSSIDFSIFDINTNSSVSLTFPTSYDSETNSVTITSDREGPFRLAYFETGDVVRLSENIIVPIGLFRLGWDEGGWDELGWDE